jgi:uncharacterized protein YbcI
MAARIQQDRPHASSVQAAISNLVVRLLAEYTGRGPTKARTTIDRDWVFVTLRDTLTKGERTLAERGRAEFVKEGRREFQEAMREECSTMIEQLTGRKVIAFLSDNHVDPDMALEAFALEAVPEEQRTGPGDAVHADGKANVSADGKANVHADGKPER